MSSFLITTPNSTEKPQIAHLIASLNSDPAHHCLHCAQQEADILEEMNFLELPIEESFVVAREEDRITAVLGADIPLERDRAWLWGPFIKGEDWDKTADSLHTHLLTLHPQLQQLNQFLNAANKRGRAFYRSQGFQETKTSHVYQARPPARPIDDPAPEIIPPQWRSFIDLHEAVFPTTYFNGRQIIKRLGKQNKIFVQAEGEAVFGYIYANVEPTEGYIHFLAVQEEARGQGIGKRLLDTAVSWLFNDQNVPQIGLVVDDQNNARRLYERCGFTLLHTGVGLRKRKE